MLAATMWPATRVQIDEPAESVMDESLIARVAKGETKAIELLYQRYGSLAFGLALRILGDRQCSEEVVQEAFFRVWRQARSFSRQRGLVAPWLMSIVHHLAIDELRRRSARPRSGLSLDDENARELPDERVDVTETVLLNLTGEQVRAALARLPRPQRQVLELAYFEGLTHREIAAALGEPLGTVHTRTRLALTKLRAQLAGFQTLQPA